MKKAQSSIEYLFALIIFFLIIISIYSFWFETNRKILDLKKRFETQVISQEILNVMNLVSNLGANSTVLIELEPDNIKYIQISSGELFLFDEEQIIDIFATSSLNITPLGKTKIKKMLISYNGGNISVS